MKRLLALCITMVLAFAILTTAITAHNGRLDSNGGHKDNHHESGLGNYHYHCGENPAHLHVDGVCPYANNSAPSVSTPISKNTTTQVGDVLGNVLYSDIKAYINGHEIQSYNINGNTMIEAEELANYGFNVVWDGEAFTLKIAIDAEKAIKPISIDKSSGKTGAVRCNYVHTNVTTYVAGVEVKGYNINGRTIIQFDELGAYGNIKWDGTTKAISFTSN